MHSVILKIHTTAHVKLFTNLAKLVDLLRAVCSGLWLGILNKETLMIINESHYQKNTKSYCDETYNRRGLWNWELSAINKYFQGCKHILVGAVGGGREVLALHHLGYDVDGFDCQPELVAGANERFSKEGVNTIVQLVPQDQCPAGHKIYDGTIMGWGAFTFIHGREQRVAVLKKLRTQLKEGAPLLISFFKRRKKTLRFKLTAAIGNTIRFLLRRDFLEVGDDLKTIYLHYFTKEEIESTLLEGGFDLVFYDTYQVGHAVGLAANRGHESESVNS